MTYVMLLLKQTTLMFLMILIGYILRKKNLISEEGTGDISRLLVNVIIPLVLINSFCRDYDPTEAVQLIYAFLLAVIALTTAAVIAKIFCRKDACLEFGASFSNAGFIGIPLVSAVFGSEAVFYAAPFVILLSVLQVSYGIYILTKKKEAMQIRTLIRNPIVISFFLSLLIYFGRIPVPDILKSLFTAVGAANSPLACIFLGYYLAGMKLHSIFTDPVVYAGSFTRLFLGPLAAVPFFLIVPADLNVKLAVLVAISAPAAINCVVYGKLCHVDVENGIKVVCQSTLLSIMTLPLVLLIGMKILG